MPVVLGQARCLSYGKVIMNQTEYLYSHSEAIPDKAILLELKEQALAQTHPILVQEGNFITAPIIFRDKIIGTLQLHAMDSHLWQEDSLAIVEAVLGQFGLLAENFQLVQELQERTQREKAIQEITTKLQSAVSMSELLAITTQALAQQLAATHVKLELGIE